MMPTPCDRKNNRSRYRNGKRSQPRISGTKIRHDRHGNQSLTYSKTNTKIVAVGQVRQSSATTSSSPRQRDRGCSAQSAVPICEFRRLSRHAASGPQARRMRRTTDFILEPPDPKGQPPTSDTLAIFDLDGLRCVAYNASGACGYQFFRNANGPRILNVTGRPEDLWYSYCRSRQRRVRCGLPCGGQERNSTAS